MGQTSRRRASTTTPADVGDVPVVGARQPCPCGSGRRYKACHGRGSAAVPELVVRPFRGLAGEVDWVMMREIVPAATAQVRLAPDTLADQHADQRAGQQTDRTATIATVLPFAWPALRRRDGEVFVGLQVQGGSGDASRDAAASLLRALEAEPGTPVPPVPPTADGPRLQDLLAVDEPFVVTMHEGFDFWIEGVDDVDSDTRASMDRANAQVVPTARLTAVDGAYWARMRDRCHLRWALPEDEEPLLDALARLHVAGGLSLGEGTRYVGAFRADGLLVPVWDLPVDAEADALDGPAGPVAGLRARLDQALARTEPLDDAERRARNGLLSRQLTLR